MQLPEIRECHKPGISALAEALTKYGSAADLSETGTGKTWRALAAAKLLNRPVFIVCLKTAKADWFDVATTLNVRIIDVVNYEAIRHRSCDWWVGGKRGTWSSKIPSDTIFIFDEAHRLGGRTTWFSAFGIQAYRQGFKTLLLSATLAHTPMQLKAAGYILGLHNLSNFWWWLSDQGARKGHQGYYVLPAWEAERAMNQIGDRLRSQGRLYGVTLRELVDLGFPENNITAKVVTTANSDTIRATYAGLQLELTALEEKLRSAPTGLAIQTRYRQIIELQKVPVIEEMVKDYLESSNSSIIIFVNYRATAQLLQDSLPKSSVIMGEQNEFERRYNIDAFQMGLNRVCICTIAAGGASINLNDTTGDRPRISLIMPTYSAVDLKQALGRCHRLTSKSPTLQQLLFVADTIEEHVFENIKSKLTNIAALTDADLTGL